jgi:selenocysteine-specific elongation factor
VTVVIGTAGHIDHGKTTLLRALTGIDADRLPEERLRGMTIDVGYAHMTLPDGRELDFVDVPGHDRLVGNMLVGAGEIDAVMLVVAADDGPRAQTIEHLELVDALGLERGLAVVTKTDLVSDTRCAHILAEVRRLLDRTGLEGAPVIPVSATRNRGLEELTAALVELADRVGSDMADGGRSTGARLAVDRVFSVKGRGVVVTGTLRGGSVATGDSLRLVPGDREIVVREVQVHGQRVERAGPGRTALNLRGVDAGGLNRGQILTTDREVTTSDRLLVALRQPARLNAAWRELPQDRTRLRVHAGTDQVDATIGRAGREAVSLSDGRVSAVVRLDRPMAVAAGDRFVLRRSSASLTEAGGVVLDPTPPIGATRRRITAARIHPLAAADSAQRSAAMLDLHGIVLTTDGPQLANDLVEQLSSRALDAVSGHHRDRPDAAGVPLATLRATLAEDLRGTGSFAAALRHAAASVVIDRLVAGGQLIRDGDHLRLPSHRPSGPSEVVVAARERLVAALDTPSPPSLLQAAADAGCREDDIRALEREGRLIRVDDDLAWSTDAYEALSRRAIELAERTPLTPAALRDATGTSRKYVMAILEDLGRRGVLRRTPDGHVPGPRSASLTR